VWHESNKKTFSSTLPRPDDCAKNQVEAGEKESRRAVFARD